MEGSPSGGVREAGITLRALITFSAAMSSMWPRRRVVDSWQALREARSAWTAIDAAWMGSPSWARPQCSELLGELTGRPGQDVILAYANMGHPKSVLTGIARHVSLCVVHGDLSDDLGEVLERRGIRRLVLGRDPSLLSITSAIRVACREGYVVAVRFDAAWRSSRKLPFMGLRVSTSPLVEALMRRDGAVVTVHLRDVTGPASTVRGATPLIGSQSPTVELLTQVEADILADPFRYDWDRAGFLYTDVRARVIAASYLGDAVAAMTHWRSGTAAPAEGAPH